MSEALENVIERSLAKSAAACDAWVTTSGVNGGCVKLIGNGIRSNGLSLYTIGISAWGTINYRVRVLLVYTLHMYTAYLCIVHCAVCTCVLCVYYMCTIYMSILNIIIKSVVMVRILTMF